jgi:tetratricopeptide (TPR) repeat protein
MDGIVPRMSFTRRRDRECRTPGSGRRAMWQSGKDRGARGLAAGLVVLLAASPWANAAYDSTRSTMRQIFHALTVVFPLSLDRAAFRDPTRRPQIDAALRALSDGAAGLATHDQDLGPTHQFVRASLAADARDALDSYEAGRFDAARFLLQEMTGACFACHSKLPSSTRFDMGARFMQEVPIQRLSAVQRARLAVAARQFDTALDAYESFFNEYPLDAGHGNLALAIEEYLQIALRVQNDFERPLATLEPLQERSDVPPYLRDEIAAWTGALRELEDRTRSGSPLDQARALVAEAERRSDYPLDPKGLVHYMLASSLLNRYLDSGALDRDRSAEAFYLLGVAESHFTSSYWLAETDLYLEKAIRLKPGTPLARQAYGALEEHVVGAYAGSSGVHVPEDVRAHLAELHALAAR